MVLSSDTVGGGSVRTGSSGTTTSTASMITAKREDRLRNVSVVDGGRGGSSSRGGELDDINCMSIHRGKCSRLSSEASCSSVSTLASYSLSDWETSSAASSGCASDVGEDLVESYSPTVLHLRQGSGVASERHAPGTSTPAALAMKGVQALLSSIAEVEREQRIARQRIDDLQTAITRLKVSYRERRISHQIVRPAAKADSTRRGICTRLSAPMMERRPSCEMPSDADVIPTQPDQQVKRDSLSGDDVFDTSPLQTERRDPGLTLQGHLGQGSGAAERSQSTSSPLLSRYHSAPGLVQLASIDETIGEHPAVVAGGVHGSVAAAPLDVIEEMLK